MKKNDIQREGKQRFRCKECKKIEDVVKWSESCRTELLARKLCHVCNFWHNNKIANSNRWWVVIDGHHYVVQDEDSGGYFRGYGGRKFIIKKNDGQVLTTTNLWHQGKIPGHLMR